jgi:hypothetical protein
MRVLQSRRLTGEILEEGPCTFRGNSSAELREYAKAILMEHYDGNETEFWPREQFANTP